MILRPNLYGVAPGPADRHRKTMTPASRITHYFDRIIFAWFIMLIFFNSVSLDADEPAGPTTFSADGHWLEDGWRLVTERQGIRIYNRPWPGSPIPEVLARSMFHSPPKRLYAVVTDYDHFAEFIPYVASSRILRQEGETSYVHQHLRLPGPVADRYYTIASSAASNRPRDELLRVEWHLVPKTGALALAEEGVVPVAFSGYWELSPHANGTSTEAAYSIHFDPGGALPSWLVTRMMNRYLVQVVEAVRAKAMQPPSVDGHQPGDQDRHKVNRR
jgi:ribosome-associated toxin RatA of RatAB toxin-antitoxin module